MATRCAFFKKNKVLNPRPNITLVDTGREPLLRLTSPCSFNTVTTRKVDLEHTPSLVSGKEIVVFGVVGGMERPICGARSLNVSDVSSLEGLNRGITLI